MGGYRRTGARNGAHRVSTVVVLESEDQGNEEEDDLLPQRRETSGNHEKTYFGNTEVHTPSVP